MRNVLFAVVFGFSLVGCGGMGEPPPSSANVDMAQGVTGAGGNGGSGGGGGVGAGASDMSQPASSTDMAHGAGGDMASGAGGSDMAGKPFGAVCTANAQCASDVCFIGGMQSFCSFRCTPATAAKDCPVPPTSGVCNNQGYCK
jgi:hypothetical protein